MELKRIIGPDVKTALKMVREQLGPDAMVLSNRRVANGIEIVAVPDGAFHGQAAAATAAPHADIPVPKAAAEPLAEALASRATRAAPQARPPEPPRREPVVAETPQLTEVRSELRSMRSFLENQLADMRIDRAAYGGGTDGRIWRRLTRLGLPNGLVRDLVAPVVGDEDFSVAWDAVLGRFQKGIGEAGDLLARGGVFAFVGPTGAGKTTTLCKLAVRYALEHGADSLALLSLDGNRIGGSDMLRAIARVVSAEFHALQADDSLDQVLRGLAGKRLVLIDTAGINRKLPQQRELLDELGRLAGRLKTLLVLPANAQWSYLDAVASDYAAAVPVACVVSKLDETASLGEALGVLTGIGLPVAYSTDGPEIPDDIRVATAFDLVANALRLDHDTVRCRRMTGPDGGPQQARFAAGNESAPRAVAATIEARIA